MLQLSQWLKEGCCSLGSEVFVEKALGLRVQIVKNVSDSWEFQRKSLVEFSQVWGGQVVSPCWKKNSVWAGNFDRFRAISGRVVGI